MNPFPKYRKIKPKKEMSEAQRAIHDQIVETHPWHQWWEGIFPGLLFIVYAVGVPLFALIVGLDPISFFLGSCGTLMVVAVYQDIKKKGDGPG